MATLSKRLLTLGLALACLVGMTGQLMPSLMAAPQITASADMAGGCPGPQPPCTGHRPNCVDHIGCVTVSVLPALPALIPAPVEWSLFDYDLAPQALAGISIKPELDRKSVV